MESMCIADSNEGLTGSGSTFLTTPGKMDYCEGTAPPDANASWGASTSALPTTWGAADQCEGHDGADSVSAAPPLLLTTVTMPSPLLEGQKPSEQPISNSCKSAGLDGPADGKPLRRPRKPLPKRITNPVKSLLPTPADKPADDTATFGFEPSRVGRRCVGKLVVIRWIGDKIAAYCGTKLDPDDGTKRANVLGGKSEPWDRAVGQAAYSSTHGILPHASEYWELLTQAGVEEEQVKLLCDGFPSMVALVASVAQQAYGEELTLEQCCDVATLVRECNEELPPDVNRQDFWGGLRIFATDLTQTGGANRWRVLFAEWVGGKGVLRSHNTAEGEFGWYNLKDFKSLDGRKREMTACFWSSRVVLPSCEQG